MGEIFFGETFFVKERKTIHTTIISLTCSDMLEVPKMFLDHMMGTIRLNIAQDERLINL